MSDSAGQPAKAIRHDRSWASGALALLAIAFVLSAWLDDDAFITFRTIDNALEGHGLRWNIAERVQSYTHPLWLFLNLLAVALTGEFFLTSLFLSFALTLATAWLLIFRVASTRALGAAAVLLLVSSKSYLDYTSSGLEDPLTRLLLVLYVIELAGGTSRSALGRGWRLGLLAALAALCRPDAMLFFVPGLALELYRYRGKAVGYLGGVAAGLLPLVVWASFALVYYGSAIPNTAYAKLAMGVPRIGLLVQGFWYIVDSLSRDPVTLVVVVIAGAVFVLRRQRIDGMVLGGAALYLAFVIWIGGDYMSGRLFGSSFLLALTVLVRQRVGSKERGHLLKLMACLLLMIAVRAVSPLFSDNVGAFGVGDERRTHHPYTGLIYAPFERDWPQHPYRWQGENATAGAVEISGGVGIYGFYAGSEVYIVDVFGVADPLLARLPGVVVSVLPKANLRNWRPGHAERRLPSGYLESLRQGENLIADPDLARFYEVLLTITRGEILSRQRLQAAVALSLGRYDFLVDSYVAKHPELFDRYGPRQVTVY